MRDNPGGPAADAPATRPLLEAAAAAVEAELALLALDAPRPGTASPLPPSGRVDASARVPARAVVDLGPRAAPGATAPVLAVLGRDDGLLRSPAGEVVLSRRHAEILAVLADRPAGLSAAQLAAEVYGRDDAVVTLRAEIVRLRRALRGVAPALGPLGRPYRLGGRLDVDAHQVLAFLERGAHRIALAAYLGPVLPGSQAPGAGHLREVVRTRLREALLTGASVDTLLAYARTDEGRTDSAVWHECLRLLPPRSPRRSAVVAHLEQLEAELGMPRRVRRAHQDGGAAQPRRLRG